MASYTIKSAPWNAEGAKDAGAWRDLFMKRNKLATKAAAGQLWKELLAKGDIVVVKGTKMPKPEKKVKIAESEVHEVKLAGGDIVPVDWRVSDPDDPHHYEFCKEEFESEAKRDARIREIKADDKLTYISKSWGDRLFNVSYWKQID